MSSANQLNVIRWAVLPAVLTWSLVANGSEIQLATSSGTVPDSKGPVVAAAATPKSDMDVQRDVLMALMHDNVNNGSTYRNVKILASKGRVTLVGHVKNEKQKTKLINITAGVVGPTNIDDQVTVK
jgi:osmotically-inducible protein OsmY